MSMRLGAFPLARAAAVVLLAVGSAPGRARAGAEPLVFEPGTVEGGDAILRSAWENLLLSATARELAARVEREAIRVNLRFADFPGTHIEMEENGPRLTGAQTGGFERDDPRGPAVLLNSRYSVLPEPFKTAAIGNTLAHEIFGHFLYMREAERAGLRYYGYHRDDELRARLLDNVVSRELGRPPRHPIDPGNLAAHYSELLETNPHYALSLSSEEMGNPLGVYTRRVEALRGRLAASLSDPSSQPNAVARLRRCLAAVEEAAGPRFENIRAAIRAESGSPFYARLEAEVSSLAARLSAPPDPEAAR